MTIPAPAAEGAPARSAAGGAVGWRPLAQGTLPWIFIAGGSLLVILGCG